MILLPIQYITVRNTWRSATFLRLFIAWRLKVTVDNPNESFNSNKNSADIRVCRHVEAGKADENTR